MRRSLLALGCGILVLLCGSGLLLVKRSAGGNLVPPGATDVRVYRHGLSELHVTYHIPPNWTLHDLYDYHAEHGWTRDRTTERGLQRPWIDIHTSVFAVWTRQSLFGLAPEIAIVGIPTDSRAGIQVRMVRCFKIEPWIGCM
jgi:hypothetical protein